MIALIDAAKSDGNTLGGIAEVICDGVPVGLGRTYRGIETRWGLAAAIASIPAVKGVEIDSARRGCAQKGIEVHDEIDADEQNVKTGRVRRRTNRAGGMEGRNHQWRADRSSRGNEPISTLMRPRRRSR